MVYGDIGCETLAKLKNYTESTEVTQRYTEKIVNLCEPRLLCEPL